MKRRFLLCLAMCALAFTQSACTTVQPWEKGYLAREEMLLTPDPLAATLNDHIFFSKEASTSGSQASGSGCGCN